MKPDKAKIKRFRGTALAMLRGLHAAVRDVERDVKQGFHNGARMALRDIKDITIPGIMAAVDLSLAVESDIRNRAATGKGRAKPRKPSPAAQLNRLLRK